MSSPSFLDLIEVTDPCPADWNGMTGDHQVRFCGQCRQHVYDLSNLTRESAEALILRQEGRLCVRFYRRLDGKVMTSDCSARLWAFPRRLGIGLGVAALALTLIGSLASALSIADDYPGRSSKLRTIEPFRTILNWIDPPNQGAVFFFDSPVTSPTGIGAPAPPTAAERSKPSAD